MTTAGLDTFALCHRDRVKALLGWAVERPLARARIPLPDIEVGVWDLWWVCFRAATPAHVLDLDTIALADACAQCRTDATALAAMDPPAHPDALGPRACDCLEQWARSMRTPAREVRWPRWRITCAMTKPGADADAVHPLLAASHTTLSTHRLRLATADVRLLYPDAYGADFTAAQDTYLTSAPVTVFVLLAHPDVTRTATEVKREIRRQLGGSDVLRNQLHMPDNPGDAFCDLAHLADPDTRTDLYERYDHDLAPARLEGYRHLLAQQPASPRSRRPARLRTRKAPPPR
ncbi:hypothetical protein GZH49_11970 [Nocardia terpenica]|uniref:hypothetical protein n=1 Tax=Nocardia terpenica TaxID=455432 RepID=UPI002FE03D06